jgi:hypothetical protein
VEKGADDYVLLTEMYTTGSSHNQLIKDTAYIAETVNAAGDIANVTVTAGADTFYSRSAYTGVVPAITGKSWTNIAGAAINGDEAVLTDPFDRYNYKNDATVSDLVVNLTTGSGTETVGVTKNQHLFNGKSTKNSAAAYEVNIVNDTVVYYVYGKQSGDVVNITDVKVGTGFDFITKVDAAAVNAIYAVATTAGKNAAGNDYAVAKVLVVEIKADNLETSVALAIRPTSKANKSVEGLLLDTTTDQLGNQSVYSSGVDFYAYITNGSNGTKTVGDLNAKIDTDADTKGEYAAAGIKIMKVYKTNVINNKNYIEYYAADGTQDSGYSATRDAEKDIISNVPDQKIFKIVEDRDVLSAVALDFSEIDNEDELIAVYNDKTLAYIIDATKSDDAVKDTLLGNIKADNVPAAEETNKITVTVTGATTTAADVTLTGTDVTPVSEQTYQYEIVKSATSQTITITSTTAGKYDITAVTASATGTAPTVSKVVGETNQWVLTNITGDFSLAITTATTTYKVSVGADDDNPTYVEPNNTYSTSSLTGTYFTIKDDEGYYYSAAGVKGTKDTPQFIEKASNSNITTPTTGTNLTITDGYVKVALNLSGTTTSLDDLTIDKGENGILVGTDLYVPANTTISIAIKTASSKITINSKDVVYTGSSYTTTITEDTTLAIVAAGE